MPATHANTVKGEVMLINITSYLKNHTETSGVEISHHFNISSSTVSRILNELKASGSADFVDGLRGKKLWDWIRGGKVINIRKYDKKGVKTRPISHIKRQIEPAKSLIGS